MDDCELIALITAVACGIAKCCSENEVAILAVAFTQLGDTLTTVITQREIRESIANQKKTTNQNKTTDQNPDNTNPGIIGTNPEAPI